MRLDTFEVADLTIEPADPCIYSIDMEDAGFSCSDLLYMQELLGSSYEIFLFNVEEDELDFTVNGFRFIEVNAIKDFLREDFLMEKQELGKLGPEFISEVTGVDYEVILSAYNGEEYHVLGELMAVHIDKCVDLYVDEFGYGEWYGVDQIDYERIGNYYMFR